MKFLCDNCKAKYQIADEKVAGRSVHMRCRKCGHQIEVRASVTENSATMLFSANLRASATPVPTALENEAQTGATGVPGGFSTSAPRAGAPRASAEPARAGGAAPRPGARPQARATQPGGLASAFSKSVTAEPRQPLAPIEGTVNVSLDMLAGSPIDDWYAGINGVPVGPMSATELRSKVAAGAINEESLVWREGQGEWVALKAVPELLEVVRAPKGRDRVSSPPPGPGAQARANDAALAQTPLASATSPGAAGRGPATMRAPLPGAPARPAAPATTSRGTTPATPAAAIAARGNVVSLQGRQATAEKRDQKPFTFPTPQTLDDPFGSPSVATPAASTPPEAPNRLSTPDAIPMASASADLATLTAIAQQASATPAAPMVEAATPVVPAQPASLAEPGRKHSNGGISLAGGIAIAGALIMGLTLGRVWSGEKAAPAPPPPVVSVAAPTSAPPSAAAPPAGEAAAELPPVDISGLPSTTRARTTQGASQAKANDPPPAPAIPNVGGVANVGGPSVLGPSVGGPSSSGSSSQLTGEQIQGVVNQGRAALKRACWEPALAARGSGATSARVSVAVAIGGDGRVQSANATGAEGYPSLGPCIAQRIRQWSFPQSAGVTQTTATFNFLPQ